MESFADLMREKRQEKGISFRALQKELLNQKGLKVSSTFLNFLERERKKPPYDVVFGLAEVLDIDTKRAFRTAYCSRTEHDRERERGNLLKALKKIGLTDLDIDEILGSL